MTFGSRSKRSSQATTLLRPVKIGFFSDIGFVVHSLTDCNRLYNIHSQLGGANDHEACKIWCANNATCGGVCGLAWKMLLQGCNLRK